MKAIKISIVVVLAAISFILCIRIFTNHKYSKQDVDRALDIYLEKIKPTKRDYRLYDLDSNGIITLYDIVQIQSKVNKR